MKKNIIILNMRYLDYEGNDITIGGVQTYISNLAKVAFELGMTVNVYQYAKRDFLVHYNGISVHGVNTESRNGRKNKNKVLYEQCMKNFDPDRDILLFGTDLLVVKEKKPFALAIQHGIGWDIESDEPCGKLKNIIHVIRQARRALIRIRNAASVKKIICVDYNYLNWYRTQVLHHEMDYQVIPNFTAVPEPNLDKQNEQKIKIIFARRLVSYRGTRIFADAVEKLIMQHDNLEITFAGDGPDEDMLRQRFAGCKNVKFITYKSDEALQIHQDKHIAVIPTVGSEGTSLSLLEAMASSCAVICSNVGGMTNIVIDNFNGLMINPNAEDLYCALDRLVSDRALRSVLAVRAYDTAQNGFSYEIWKEKWKKLLTDFE